MPDFTEAVAPVCSTVEHFSTKVDGYRVTYGPTPYGPYQHGWECECGAKVCAHIFEAKDRRCGWNWELEPRSMPEGNKCPDCGGALTFVKVAV